MRRALTIGVILVLLGGAFAYGLAVGHYRIFPFDLIRKIAGRKVWSSGHGEEYGRWFRLRDDAGEEEPDLAGHPYLGGYEPAPSRSGAVVRDRKRICEGLTLYCSGHAPSVPLVDVDGKVVHEWTMPVWGERPEEAPVSHWENHRSFVRKAHVLPNGDLLAVFEYLGIVRIDKDSKRIWSRTNQAHHDIAITPGGTIVTLTRRFRTSQSLAVDHPGAGLPNHVLDDCVTFLDPEGNEIRRVSLLDAFLASDYAPHVFAAARNGWDCLHTNSVDVVGPAVAARVPFASEGDVLVSIRELDTVAILDPDAGRIRWISTGMWHRQHQATFLTNGNVLLFDNRGGFDRKRPGREWSRVIEFDPLSREVRWSFGDAPSPAFYSYSLGSVRRLPNGNTLITESHQGHILEVAPDGRIVWEYWNPHRAGENDRLIATILGARRIDPANLDFL